MEYSINIDGIKKLIYAAFFDKTIEFKSDEELIYFLKDLEIIKELSK